jgi:hypothetical protein
MAYSSLISSLIIPSIVKASGSKDQLKLDSVLRALTLNLNTALIYREKLGPILIVTTIENGIAIVVDKNIIQGLLNYLTIINKALKEIRRGLAIDLVNIIISTLRIIRAVAKKVDDFV